MNILSQDQLKALGLWFTTSIKFMMLDPVLRWVLVAFCLIFMITLWILLNAAEAAERPRVSPNSHQNSTGNDPGYY